MLYPSAVVNCPANKFPNSEAPGCSVAQFYFSFLLFMGLLWSLFKTYIGPLPKIRTVSSNVLMWVIREQLRKAYWETRNVTRCISKNLNGIRNSRSGFARMYPTNFSQPHGGKTLRDSAPPLDKLFKSVSFPLASTVCDSHVIRKRIYDFYIGVPDFLFWAFSGYLYGTVY